MYSADSRLLATNCSDREVFKLHKMSWRSNRGKIEEKKEKCVRDKGRADFVFVGLDGTLKKWEGGEEYEEAA